MSATENDPTRSAAFELLIAVSEKRRTIEEALDQLPPLDGRDRAAAHRLAASVIRRQGTLDAVLGKHLRRDPPDRVRLALRIGAAGLLLLETPPHAAVGTAVDLVRSHGLAPFAGLVNAVLRRVASEGVAALAAIDGPLVDTPDWLWASWGDQARAIATAHQSEAPLDLTMRPGLRAPAAATPLPGGSARLPAGTRVTDTPGYAEGDFWVQDVAASLPARLLGIRPGERVCDMCAAPGGKTAQLALAGGIVTALDRDHRRMRRLAENVARLGLDIETLEVDAVAYARGSRRFDAVLLDAPCSATGTIRRHPDVQRLRREGDPASVAATQAALLDAAARLLEPGGRLVYAVCSLQREEGEDRLAEALGSGDWRHDPIVPGAEPVFDDPEMAALVTSSGNLATSPALWPDRGGMDGFFATRLIRV